MQRHIYLREFNGTAWEQINNSATGLGVSAAVQGAWNGGVANNLQPSLAYSGSDLLVAWQTHSDTQPLLAVANYRNSAGNPQLVYTAAIAGGSAQPTLISAVCERNWFGCTMPHAFMP